MRSEGTPSPADGLSPQGPVSPFAAFDELPRRMGRYVLESLLASGGMGQVYLARAQGPAGFQKTVVIKCILGRELMPGSESVALFLNEARLAALLTHPNIVQTFELGEEEGLFFLAMEYVEGLTLRSLAQALTRGGAKLSAAIAVHICAQVLHGLHHAHTFTDRTGALRPILHRDVSPENVLLSATGAVKVTDFGVARMTEPGQHTTGLARGKVAYMAPERLGQGYGPVDGRCDVFSVAVMLYELLAGSRPFRGDSPLVVGQSILAASELPLKLRRPDLPDELAALVHRGLAKHVEERFGSALEFASALESFASAKSLLMTQGQLSTLVSGLAMQQPTATPRAPIDVDRRTARLGHGPADAPTAPEPLARPAAEAPPLTAAVAVTSSMVVRSDELPSRPGRPSEQPTSDRPTSKKYWVIALCAAAVLAGLFAVAMRQRAQPLAGVDEVSAPPVIAAQAASAVAVETAPSPEVPAVDVTEAAARPATPKAPRGRGWLELRVHPWAEVWVDGRKMGVTPVEPIELTAGRHQLRLTNPDAAIERKVSFSVVPKATVLINVNLLTQKVTSDTRSRP